MFSCFIPALVAGTAAAAPAIVSAAFTALSPPESNFANILPVVVSPTNFAIFLPTLAGSKPLATLPAALTTSLP